MRHQRLRFNLTIVRYKIVQLNFCFKLKRSLFLGCDIDPYQLKLTFSVYRRTSHFTMTTKPSAVIPQIGRPTSSNDPTSFGSEITRLTGELLADTTQMAPYIQITWEPRLKILISSERYPRCQVSVDPKNMWTSEEISAWIVPQRHGIRKEVILSTWTVPGADLANFTEAR